ncbi:MAG: extracellular solute-binding protein [Thermoprotei archaeon]|nr:extracellular solute-binding protein [TACK group archaeon]
MKKGISKLMASLIALLVIIAAGVSVYFYTARGRGVTLTVVVVGGWNQQTVEMAAQQYEKLYPNVHFNFVVTTFSNVEEKEIVAESQGNSSSYDIFTWSPTMSGALAPYVYPLNSLINSSHYNVSDLSPALLSFGGEYYNQSAGKTQIIGLPIDTSLLVLFYRTDIFDNATYAREFQADYGVPFNPNDWTNWTEVIWADKFVTSHNITKYGMIVDDNVAHGLIDTFPAVFYWWYSRNSTLNGGTAGGLPGYNVLFTKSLQPSFAGPDGVKALETIKELISYEPSPTILTVDYSHLQSLFGTGEYAMDLAWSGFYDNFNNPSKYPAIAGKVGMALLPGGYSEAGGSFLGIAKYSKHKAQAWAFLEFLTSDKEAAKLYYEGGFPPSELGAISIISSNATHATEFGFYVKAVATAYANPPTLPITSTKLMPVINNAIYQYITGKGQAYPLLAQAASQWEQAVQS